MSQAAALLAAHRPEITLRIINTGSSGNRVTDLADRWEEDVLNFQPDWVSVMIGINDVWRHFDRPFMTQVSLDQYQTILEKAFLNAVGFEWDRSASDRPETR